MSGFGRKTNQIYIINKQAQMQNLIINTLSTDWYTPVNKELAKQLWFICAWYLGELIRQSKRFWGWEFYFSQSQMEAEIWINQHTQRVCVKDLTESWIISVQKKWIPPVYHFQIKREKIGEMLWVSNASNFEGMLLNDIDIPVPEEKTFNVLDWKEDKFEEFWQVYPKHTGKKKAEQAFKKAVKKVSPDLIILKAKEYAEEIKKKWIEDKYIKRPQGWLNDERYLDWEQPKNQYTINSITEDMLSRDWKAKWASIKGIENIDLRVERMKKFVEEVNKGQWLKK